MDFFGREEEIGDLMALWALSRGLSPNLPKSSFVGSLPSLNTISRLGFAVACSAA